jgi:FtsZ-interacting cell division protein ZipA
MAQIKPPVRSLEDIDDNLQGRNSDEETTTTTQTDDSQPKRTFYRSPSEGEEQNKPAESEKPEDDEDLLEAAEDELEPKPEP